MNTTAWKALTPEEFWARVGSDEGSFALPTLVQSFVSADWGQATQHALYLNQVSYGFNSRVILEFRVHWPIHGTSMCNRLS